MSNAARAIAFLRERFEGTAGDIMLTALSEPKEANVGRPREYRLARPVAIERLAQIIAKEDKPNRGLFFCVGTLKPDAVKSPKGFYRTKANILQLPGPHVDIDFKHLMLPASVNPIAEVTRQVTRSRWAPKPIVVTGGGVHAYWRTAQPIEAQDFEQAETVMRALARHCGGDPAVAEVARLMRLPGTSNWKYGEPRRCLVSLHGEATIDIWDEEVGAGEPLFERGTRMSDFSGHPRPVNAFEAYAAEHQPPIDPDGRLAEMLWQGPGESGVHATQLSVTAALLNAGVPRDEVIEQVFHATMAKPFAQGWDAHAEARTITGMVDSFAAKLVRERRPNGPAHGTNGEAPAPKSKAKAAPIAFELDCFKPRGEAVTRREWLYGEHYVRVFTSTTIGVPGAGKSNMTMTETLAMTSHSNLLRHASEEPLRVWYHNGEDPKDELTRRFQAAMIHYNVSDDDLGGRLFVTSGRDLKLILAEPGLRQNQVQRNVELIAWIKRTIIWREIDVWIVDPLVAMHRLDENSNVQMAELAEIFAEIARDAHCAVELVHHSRKTGGEEVTVEHARGASALIAAARSARVLNTMTEEEAERFGVSERRRTYFRVDNGKASMRPPPDDADWFRTLSVNLDNGAGGLPGDDVGVVASWEPPGMLDAISMAKINEAMGIIGAGRDDGEPWRHSDRSVGWVGDGIAPALGIDAQERTGRRRLNRIIELWIGNKMLKVVEVMDKNRKLRKCVVPGAAASVRQ